MPVTGLPGGDGTGEPLLLWSAEPAAADGRSNVLLWQGNPMAANQRSLVAYLEAHAEEIRRRYLAWVHDLGETAVLGRRLRDHFVSRDGSSLWVQSLFFEQSTWKQESLESLLKLLALQRLLDEERPVAIEFVGADPALDTVLRGICRQRGIGYASQRVPARRAGALAPIGWRLPSLIGAWAALGRLALRSFLLGPATRGPAEGSARRSVLICGPFFNYNIQEPAGEFVSCYWGRLPQALVDSGSTLEWLHYFYGHQQALRARSARQLLERINRNRSAAAHHSFVEAYATPRLILRVSRRWLQFAVASALVGLALRAGFRRRPTESYWPLIRRDWARAFRGHACIESLFYGACFERALQLLPRHDEGIYLMENQSWERALARAWRRDRHGRLSGVVHSTIRFWDLRYHCDPRRYAAAYAQPFPRADAVVVNGAAARRQYLSTCATREAVIDCEALRYQHLRRSPAGVPAVARDRGPVKILVLGDYVRAQTDATLRTVTAALHDVAVDTEIQVKPHPSCHIAPGEAGFAFTVVGKAVPELIAEADLVVASKSTSAAVDAYVCGARVVVHDDRCGANYSPLRGEPGVEFVCTPEELRSVIESAGRHLRPARSNVETFFNIDTSLRRWRRYFGLIEDGEERILGQKNA